MSPKKTGGHSIGDRVTIWNSQMAEDLSVYCLTGRAKMILSLTCETTGRVIKVHESRISRNLSKKEPQMSEANLSEQQQQQSKKVVTKVTQAPAAKPKAEKKRTPLNFKALMASAGENAERWSKAMPKDKHPEGRSHCIIRGDRAACTYFATYYNSLGPKRSKATEQVTFDNISKVYAVASYDDLIKKLKTEGYSRS